MTVGAVGETCRVTGRVIFYVVGLIIDAGELVCQDGDDSVLVPIVYIGGGAAKGRSYFGPAGYIFCEAALRYVGGNDGTSPIAGSFRKAPGNEPAIGTDGEAAKLFVLDVNRF